MKDYKSLENELFEEIKSRIKEDDSSVPYLENGYYYYTRYEKGKHGSFIKKGGNPLFPRSKGFL